MKKIISISLFILLLSGCSTLTSPITEYKIHTQIAKKSFNKNACSNKTLKISQAFASNSLMSLSMKYMQGDDKQFAYSESQWTDSPNRALTLQILKSLKNTDLFKSVQISQSISKNDWILEINIEDFMQYFSEDFSKSYVKTVICLTLIDSNSRGVVATKTFSSRVQAKTLDAKGGVDALNKALQDVLTQDIDWFSEMCK